MEREINVEIHKISLVHRAEQPVRQVFWFFPSRCQDTVMLWFLVLLKSNFLLYDHNEEVFV